MTPDVLYRVADRAGEELRYSLRSLVNVPHDRVWVAGHVPEWVVGVTQIDSPVLETKWSTILAALTVACDVDELSKDVLLIDDDVFIMVPITHVPPYHRGLLQDHPRRSEYGEMYDVTERLLRSLGSRGGLLSYELHTPFPFDKLKMRSVLAAATETVVEHGVVGKSFHPRTLYGNVYRIGGTRLHDPKVALTDAIPRGPFVSTTDATFARKPVGRYVRNRFPDPGPYERRHHV